MLSKGVMAFEARADYGEICEHESRYRPDEEKILKECHLILNIAVVDLILCARDPRSSGLGE